MEGVTVAEHGESFGRRVATDSDKQRARCEGQPKRDVAHKKQKPLKNQGLLR
jgi:hypothetical protein